MQNLRTLVKSSDYLLFNPISFRTYSTNPKELIKFGIGQVKKFIYGSENPYNSRDLIYEQMRAENVNMMMHRYIAKVIYARQKARKRYVKHNERIRHLEDKINGGAYQTKSFSNRF